MLHERNKIPRWELISQLAWICWRLPSLVNIAEGFDKFRARIADYMVLFPLKNISTEYTTTTSRTPPPPKTPSTNRNKRTRNGLNCDIRFRAINNSAIIFAAAQIRDYHSKRTLLDSINQAGFDDETTDGRMDNFLGEVQQQNRSNLTVSLQPVDQEVQEAGEKGFQKDVGPKKSKENFQMLQQQHQVFPPIPPVSPKTPDPIIFNFLGIPPSVQAGITVDNPRLDAQQIYTSPSLPFCPFPKPSNSPSQGPPSIVTRSPAVLGSSKPCKQPFKPLSSFAIPLSPYFQPYGPFNLLNARQPNPANHISTFLYILQPCSSQYNLRPNFIMAPLPFFQFPGPFNPPNQQDLAASIHPLNTEHIWILVVNPVNGGKRYLVRDVHIANCHSPFHCCAILSRNFSETGH